MCLGFKCLDSFGEPSTNTFISDWKSNLHLVMNPILFLLLAGLIELVEELFHKWYSYAPNIVHHLNCFVLAENTFVNESWFSEFSQHIFHHLSADFYSLNSTREPKHIQLSNYIVLSTDTLYFYLPLTTCISHVWG